MMFKKPIVKAAAVQISPVLEIPCPYIKSNSAFRNGGANLFLTTLTRTRFP